MNKTLKKLMIKFHPDRHGGDHSLMEQVYAAPPPPSNSRHNKKWCWCGARIGAAATSCRLHWRSRRALAAALLLLTAVGCSAVKKTPVYIPPTAAKPPQEAITSRMAATNKPPLPTAITSKMAAVVAPAVKTNGVVTLKWDNGDPPETFIVNQTSGVVTPAGTVGIITLGGLRSGTNTFIATNASGKSLPVSALIAPDKARLGFYPYIFRADWPGAAAVLQSSTNLVIWKDERDFPASGILLVTNILTQPGFHYRVRVKP